MKARPKKKARRPIAKKVKAAPKAVRVAAPASKVRALREALGLTQDSFARLTGFSVRTIAKWEGEESPTDMKVLTEVERLRQALQRVIRSEYVGQWLQTPNDAFGGLKPIEVIERGEVDRIWRMIYELESGIPT